MNPEKFLAERYNIHASDEAANALAREATHHTAQEQSLDSIMTETRPLKPQKERLATAYLERMEHIIGKKRGAQMIAHNILKQFSLNVNNEETLTRSAEQLYQAEVRLATDRGHGGTIMNLESSPELLEKYKAEVLQKHEAQQATLTPWLNYLEANDAGYPMWFRYLIARSLKEMGVLNKGEHTYSKRTAQTLTPFPEMNAEALAAVYTAINTQFNIESAPKEEQAEKERAYLDTLPLDERRRTHIEEKVRKALQGKNFAKLYALAQIETEGTLNRESTEGEWVIFPKGSDPHLLEKTLQGKSTGWCTATGSAPGQLEQGDFHVYFTRGTSGQYTEPRVAIRIADGEIAEVRGVDAGQALEPELTAIAKERYEALPGGDKYDKRDSDMRRLTSLANIANKRDTEVVVQYSSEDLLFLYEIDQKIEGFGYNRDPRINKLLEGREKRTDLAIAFNCRPEQIAFTQDEALSGDIVYHQGHIYLNSLTSAEGLMLPRRTKTLDLRSLTSAEGLVLPEQTENLDLRSLTSAEGLIFPKQTGGLNLSSLTEAEGFVLPQRTGNLHLNSLTSAKGLVLPLETGSLNLSSLTETEGLVLPEKHGEIYSRLHN